MTTPPPSIDVVALEPGRLDLRPSSSDLPHEAASWRVTHRVDPGPAGRPTALRQWGDELVLSGSSLGISTLDPSAPALPSPGEATAFGRLGPSPEGGPVWIGADGRLGRWQDGRVVFPWSDLGVPGQPTAAWGLGAGRLAVQRRRTGLGGLLGRALPDSTRAVLDVFDAAGTRLWSYSGECLALLPWRDLLLVAPSGGTRLLALSSDDGGEQWRYDPPHRPARLLAVVAGGLWWLDWQGGLNRVDVATGRNPERWTFPHLARPTGRVSAQGRLVMCEGSGLTVFDLTRGEQLVRRPFSGPPRPRRAHGQAAVLTKGGGILFVEPDGNLWAATYTDDAVARRVGKVETRPVDLTAAAGRLVLLLEGGAVIVLEPEMSG